jgi:hypothetical protein
MTSLAHTPQLAGVVLRSARPDDAEALDRLASLDSRRAQRGPALVAEENGALRAAVYLESGDAVADPFTPSAHLVTLLRHHAARRATPPAAARGRRVLRGLVPATR